MSAFNDGTCGKCKRRMGWTGELIDKPPCPYCGHRPSAKELEDMATDQAEMDKMEQLLIRKAQAKKNIPENVDWDND